jgi:hypothetical protein
MEALPLTTSVDAPHACPAVVPVSCGAAVRAAPEAGGASALQGDWSEQFRRSLQVQHGRVREFLAAQHDRWKAAETQLLAKIERLAAEAQSLREQCARLREESADRACQGTPGESPEADDFRRRYEMALDDLRELKARNVDLQKELTQAQGQAGQRPARGSASSGKLDWESEKQRILAALESESDSEDPEAVSQRLSIEDVIRKTDQLLAEKDREIEDLHKVLKEQSGNLGAMAVGAAALGEVLDQDAIVREERENLKRLQEECRAKLRQAEIDISLERAKLARQQADLTERLRESELRASTPENQAEALSATGRPVRGRWLARLGLKDLDEGRKG